MNLTPDQTRLCVSFLRESHAELSKERGDDEATVVAIAALARTLDNARFQSLWEKVSACRSVLVSACEVTDTASPMGHSARCALEHVEALALLLERAAGRRR